MTDDHTLAAELATAAGDLLLRTRDQHAGIDPKELKDIGDQVAHDFLMAELAKARPQDAVLSEEGADDHARLTAARVWIVDPLDGTREFSEAGRDDWAVHVALWQDGQLVAGAVGRPAKDVTYSSADNAPAAGTTGAPLRLAVSRSRPPEFVTLLADHLGAELVEMGSAGVKAMSVLEGQTDAYVHAGGQYEWDSAAPVAVASAHGLHTSRIDGSRLVYNNENPYLPDLVVCRPEVAETVLEGIRAVNRG
ncbi:3'(2'),5'-bisphosphate nucleotidase CysQ [Janibacter cremeus]|uniref:3'(2'),5-bisphosphonucleoside 3'(2')-phosphohydrolase n=1 Tax=Janibacter cremeus TaxID=1285192 RepID=A0A852VNY1_9MICO|nr:3'(2'),5'-bisphosphate nucleotidase CysQ [Janibacter cremeus]NYF97398.1 3'(2'), 5'-bisphosphate nucleotidase [Janibacter cremeus]